MTHKMDKLMFPSLPNLCGHFGLATFETKGGIRPAAKKVEFNIASKTSLSFEFPPCEQLWSRGLVDKRLGTDGPCVQWRQLALWFRMDNLECKIWCVCGGGVSGKNVCPADPTPSSHSCFSDLTSFLFRRVQLAARSIFADLTHRTSPKRLRCAVISSRKTSLWPSLSHSSLWSISSRREKAVFQQVSSSLTAAAATKVKTADSFAVVWVEFLSHLGEQETKQSGNDLHF